MSSCCYPLNFAVTVVHATIFVHKFTYAVVAPIARRAAAAALKYTIFLRSLGRVYNVIDAVRVESMSRS
jgi:hypothetical protein